MTLLRTFKFVCCANVLLVGPSCSLHAESSCQSDYIFVQFTSCATPGNGLIFKEMRSSKCKVEAYNSCPEKRTVFSDYYYFEEFAGPHPNDCTVDGEARIKDQKQRDLVVTSAAKSYLERYKRSESGQITPEPALDDIKAKLEKSSRRVFGDWAGRGWCKYFVAFDVVEPTRRAECGVEAYSPCRDPSHGVEGYVKKQSKYCPSEADTFYLVSMRTEKQLAEQLIEKGDLTCSTLDSLSENGEGETRQKIVALQANLDLLKSRKSSRNAIVLTPTSFTLPDSSNLVRTRLQVLLELDRLYRIVGNEQLALNGVEDEIEATLPQITADLEQPYTSDFEGLIDSFDDTRSYRALLSLAAVFPQGIEALAQKNRSKFIEMNDLKYSLLFPRGVSLSEPELRETEMRLPTINSSTGVYRLAEAAVRTGLKQVATLQRRALQLMDLRVRLYRDDVDYQRLVREYQSITSESVERVSGRFAAYRDNNELLREAASNIINFNIKALNDTSEATEKALWNIISVAKEHSADPRLPLLDGYKNLAEMNASAFGLSLRAAIENVTKAGSVMEFQNSVQLLVGSAKDNLQALVALKTMLSEVMNERDSMERTIVGKMADVLKQSESGDETALLVFHALADFKGGPGSESGLQDELLALISDNYSQFILSLERLPELGS